jgi:hypothetical protein
MAICVYCGKSSGFFSKYHQACFDENEKNRIVGAQKLKAQISTALKNKQPYPELRNELNQTASLYNLSSEVIGQTVLSSIDELSREEPLEPAMADYLFQLGEDTVGKFGNIGPDSPFYPSSAPSFFNITMSRILWLIMHGQPVNFLNPCDFVLQPGESRLCEFGTVLYRKTVMVSTHAGGYNGVSVRVASGLYYRFGGYGGQSVSTPVQNLDTGFLILTNTDMCFSGQQKTFRIGYGSILRFKPYPDGLGFFRNVGDGREEIFTIVDPYRTCGLRPLTPLPPSVRFDLANAVTFPVGWFLYNLVTFLTTPAPHPVPDVERTPTDIESGEGLGLEATTLRDVLVQPIASQQRILTKTLTNVFGKQYKSQLQAAQGSLSDEDLAKGNIGTDFGALIIHMFACSGPITDREAQFYQAVQEQLKPGVFKKFTGPQMKVFIDTLAKPGSPFTEPYTKPLTLTYLETYDTTNGSHFGEQVREFLVRLATAAASVDGPPSSRTMAELRSVKAALTSGPQSPK